MMQWSRGWLRVGRYWYTLEGLRLVRVPDIRGGVAMDPTIDQNVWARVADDGSESGSTIVTQSASDGGWTQDVDTVFRVRFEMVETAGNNATNTTFQLQYNHESGGWTNVTTSAAPIQATVSAETSWTVTDGDATTDRLSGSAGTFSAAEYSEDGLTGAVTTQASRHTEVEYCVTIPSAQVSDSDTILLRVIMSGDQGTPTYGATPTITVNEGVPPTNLAAGNQWLTVQAPTATLVPGASTQAAGNQFLTIQAPDASIVAGGGAQNLAAGDQVQTVQAPTATLSASVTLAAGTNILALSAATATLVPGASTLAAGSNDVALSAPAVTVSTSVTLYTLGDPGSSTAILDDFNRADEGPPPSANWSAVGSDAGFDVVSNEIHGTQTGFNVAGNYWNPISGAEDVEVFITLSDLTGAGAGDESFLWARRDTAAHSSVNGYTLAFAHDDGGGSLGKIGLEERTSGASSVLARWVRGSTFIAGDAFALRTVGTAIEGWFKPSGANGEWSLVLRVTDSTHTSGVISVGLYENNSNGFVNLDDFGGGSLNLTSLLTVQAPDVTVSQATQLAAGAQVVALVAPAATVSTSVTLYTYGDPGSGTAVLDDFNRGDEDPATGWTWNAAANEGQILTNKLAGGGTNTAQAIGVYDATGSSLADCESFVTVDAIPGSYTVGVYARSSSPTSDDSYSAFFASGSGNFTLSKNVATVESTLASTPLTLSVGDEVSIRCIGTRIEAWHKPSAGDWTLIVAATDSSHASGSIGVLSTGDAGNRLDDFSGGAIHATNILSLSAPDVTLSQGQFASAGANDIALSAPAATLVAGASTIAAGSNDIALSAPDVTLLSTVTISAGSQTQTVEAPDATLDTTSGAQNLSAGANDIALSAATAVLTATVTLAAGSQVQTVEAPTAVVVPGGSSLAAGDQAITVEAPPASLGLAVTLSAGANDVALSAPTATLSAGAVALDAGAQGLTIEAPAAVRSTTVTLAAGANVQTVEAPDVALSLATVRAAGTNDIALSAPAAVAVPGASTLSAGAQDIALSAPTSVLSTAISLLAGAQNVALSAPSAVVSAGASTLAAGANVIAITAALAALTSSTALNAGAQTQTVQAPAATVQVGEATVAAGAQVQTVQAPNAALVLAGNVLAGAQILTVQAPDAIAVAGGTSVAAGAQDVTVQAPDAGLATSIARDAGPQAVTVQAPAAAVDAVTSLAAGAQVQTVEAPDAVADTTVSLAAGSQVQTVQAPTVTLSQATQVLAGKNDIALLAPAATAAAGATTVTAGSQVQTIQAPTATADAPSSLAAGTQDIALSAPSATASAGGSSVDAGAQGVTVQAPAPVVDTTVSVAAVAQAVTVQAPDATASAGESTLTAGAQELALSAGPAIAAAGAVTLAAGSQTQTVEAPAVVLTQTGVVTRQAGAQGISLSAPSAVVFSPSDARTVVVPLQVREVDVPARAADESGCVVPLDNREVIVPLEV